MKKSNQSREVSKVIHAIGLPRHPVPTAKDTLSSVVSYSHESARAAAEHRRDLSVHYPTDGWGGVAIRKFIVTVREA